MRKSDVRQMAWLHLKLLAARVRRILQVISSAEAGQTRARRTEKRRVIDRLSGDAIGDELKRSLEQQLEVLRSRRAGHTDAQHRRELVEAGVGAIAPAGFAGAGTGAAGDG